MGLGRGGTVEGGVPKEGESVPQEACRRTAPREAPTSMATPSSVIPGLPAGGGRKPVSVVLDSWLWNGPTMVHA